MATLFTDDFDGGQTAFDANWQYIGTPSDQVQVQAGGYSLNGYWISCQTGQSCRDFTATHTVNVSFLCCAKVPAGSSTEFLAVAALNSGSSGPGVTTYLISFNANGSINFRMNNVLSMVTSGVGLVPITGASFGIQIRLDRTGNFTSNVIITVNNVDVWTFAYDWTIYAGTVTTTSNYSRIYLYPSFTAPFVNKAALDNLRVDNVTTVISSTGYSLVSLANGCSGRTAIPVTPERGSGLYTLDPALRHDKIYINPFLETTENVKFPDPHIVTYLIGDE